MAKITINKIKDLKKDIAASEERIEQEQQKIQTAKSRIKEEKKRIASRKEEIVQCETELVAEQFRKSNLSVEDALARLTNFSAPATADEEFDDDLEAN